MTRQPQSALTGFSAFDRRRFLALSATAAAATALGGVASAQGSQRGRPHVAIIGGGVIGMVTAWHLLARKVGVTLIDPAPGQGCTQGSFAMLIATQPGRDEAFNTFYIKAIAEWHRFQRDIGPQLPVQWGGIVNWAKPGALATELDAARVRLTGWGANAVALDRSDITDLCPGTVVGEFGAGYFQPDQGAVDVNQLMAVLTAHVTRAGCRFVRSRVTDIAVAPSGTTGLITDDGTIVADQIVLAAGSANAEFAARLGAHVPLDLPSGVLAISQPTKPLLRRILNGPLGSIKQNADGRIVTGLDYKPGAMAQDRSASYGHMLLNTAARTVPELRGIALDRVVYGAVPIPAHDQMPVMGRLPGSPSVYVINAMSGVTVAPLLARMATTEIVGGLRLEALASFRPERFSAAL
ncbi:NAD(P)/FAD-dependent oxidoreductase [Novosphingobium aerophilum]|uniref:FAD-binding oxidoreductase n=1 Tax=Novosphingobium aerophilum TaxID=2839843 RepID=A0A7X1FAK8_9SPHN|nr:FAD-dependent oxidoreductase [Novosphingobium aerophilum]MBC2653462.1 FAD-binding oxidoreductase [Novosphingobium aerophilum]